jgi:hypothetical protein
MSLRPTVHGGMAPPASSLATAQEANMKKLFITAALFLATTSAYAGNGCDHDSPRSNYYSSRSNDDSNEQSQSSSYDSQRSNYNSSRPDYGAPRPRYNPSASSPSPRPRATIRRARTITRHPRATIRHVRILVHDAKETRLLPARIRTTKKLDPVRRSSGLRPRGALDLAIAIRLALEA